MKKNILGFLLLVGLVACAQVPKESVTLSATVGRDMAEMQKSHIAVVDLYYDRLQKDINRFIDDVYMPFQIHATLSDDLWRNELVNAIKSAAIKDPTGKKQKEGYEKIEIFLQILNEEIEAYRLSKLTPIKMEKEEVRRNINEAYDRIFYANSIVTGHLASVVEVHNAQDELLAKVDLKGYREKAAVKTAALSDKIADLIKDAKKADSKSDEFIQKFENLLNKNE